MTDAVSSLYIHIPFCPKKCDYCAFVTHVGSERLIGPYVEALKTEARSFSQVDVSSPLETVYFGGGTPSMLKAARIDEILQTVDSLFGLTRNTEITLEVHPATVSPLTLSDYLAAGVNRISAGAESLDNTELQALGRNHTARQLEIFVLNARAAGVRNLNLDLMYGLPGQTLESWLRSLDTVVEFELDHVSLYPLSIEPKTVFARKMREHRLTLPEDSLVSEMYHVACYRLRDAGFIHYEVANWAKPGMECRHNMTYWRNRQYLAIGVGAHGYLRPFRTENVAGTRRYIDTIVSGASPVMGRTHLDRRNELNEQIMLNLRLLQDGLDTGLISQRFGVNVLKYFSDEIDAFTSQGLLCRTGATLVLAEHAVPVANEVWSRFVV